MSTALDPHCWKATSLADPEYVMDFRSPNAFCALAITVFASCAMAFPHRYARHIATTASFFTTATPPSARQNRVRVHGLRVIPAGVNPVSGNSAATGQDRNVFLTMEFG